MKYKVGDEVVLSDRLMIHVIGSKRVVISGFNYDGDKYETKGGNAIWYFNDDQIDHENGDWTYASDGRRSFKTTDKTKAETLAEILGGRVIAEEVTE